MEFESVRCERSGFRSTAAACYRNLALIAEGLRVFLTVAVIFKFSRPQHLVDCFRVFVAAETDVGFRFLFIEGTWPTPERIFGKLRRETEEGEMTEKIVSGGIERDA